MIQIYRVFILLAALSALTACASFGPTPYQDKTDGYGFVTETAKDLDGNIVVFSGNKYTSISRAKSFTHLKANEICDAHGKLALIIGTFDKTTELNYTQVVTNTNTIPGYSKFQGKTYRNTSRDFTTVSTSSYPVKERYPRYFSVFQCVDSYKALEDVPKFEEIGRDLVHEITKDFKGGLIVKKTSVNSVLREGDVVINVGDKRCEISACAIIEANKADKHVQLKIIRNGKIKTVKAKVKDYTSALALVNAKFITDACVQKRELEEDIPFCVRINEKNTFLQKILGVEKTAL